LLALTLFLGAGCGLGDYEKLMENEQKRLEEFDKTEAEEAKYLGDPLEMPKKQVVRKDDKGKPEKDPKGEIIYDEVDALPVEFFLRPPKGIKEKAEKEPQGKLYKFKAEDGPVLYLGALSAKATSQEAFKKIVCNGLGISSNTAGSHEQKESLGGNRRTFLRMEKSGSDGFLVFLYQVGDDQLAIAFKGLGDKLNDQAFLAAVDASLKSVEIGSRGQALSSAYRRNYKTFNQLRLKFMREDMRQRRSAP
jgi:hypothetical protein